LRNGDLRDEIDSRELKRIRLESRDTNLPELSLGEACGREEETKGCGEEERGEEKRKI
jgi:hypothetical protein